jgi:AhpD family alkylhydroperoxidase
MDILKELQPEAHKVLIDQNTIVMKDGALSTKMKELMAVSLSIAVRCEPCLKVHIQRAIKAGATNNEIAEALAVTTLMCGGPAYVWSKKTVDEEIKI